MLALPAMGRPEVLPVLGMEGVRERVRTHRDVLDESSSIFWTQEGHRELRKAALAVQVALLP